MTGHGMTALWLIWQVAHLIGLPMAAGYFVGRWAQRRDDRRDANYEDRTATLERRKQ